MALIALGCGAYGFTVGLRNGWEMGAYVAVKLPLIIFITLIVNGLLNGLLGLVLGSGIGFRKSVQFLLTGFAIMAVILGALSPISFFATLNMPSSGDGSGRFAWHGASLLMHTCLIAFAGITAHARLLHYVREFADSSRAGTYVFFAWLAGIFLLGHRCRGICARFLCRQGSRSNSSETIRLTATFTRRLSSRSKTSLKFRKILKHT